MAENKEIYLIIPDQFSYEYDKKLYKELGSSLFNKLFILSFSKIAKKIIRELGGEEGEYANDVTKRILMHKVLREIKKEKSAVFYSKQLEKRDFIDTSLDLVSDFSHNNIDENTLENGLNQLDGMLKEKLTDVKNIVSKYKNSLSNAGLKDSLSDVDIARNLAISSNYFSKIDIFVDEFDGFSADEFSMLELIIKQSSKVCVSLRIGEGENTKTKLSPFDNVKITEDRLVGFCRDNNISVAFLQAKECEIANPVLQDFSEIVFSPKKHSIKNDGVIKIISASDIYKEVEFVASTIRKLIIENGYKYSDFAVVATETANYKSSVLSIFEKYEIPYFYDLKQGTNQKSLVIFLLSILECLITRDYKTENILKYVKSNFSFFNDEEIFAIEEYCYKWNVNGKDWLGDFTAKQEKSGENLEFINQIRVKIISPFQWFKTEIKGKNADEIANSFNILLEKICFSQQLEGVISHFKEENSQGKNLEVIREFKQIIDLYNGIISNIYSVLAGEKITLKEFYELLKSLFFSAQVSLPPQTLDSVIIADLERSRLSNIKVTFILGATEGAFPKMVKEGGIFTEKDKSILSEIGINISKPALWKIAQERLISYSALTTPTEKLFISYPLSDIKGASKRPAYLVKQIKNMLSSEDFIRTNEVSPTYFAMTKGSAYSTFLENITEKNDEICAIETVLKEDNFYAERLDYLEKNSGEILHKLTENNGKKIFSSENFFLSPTKIESFYNCPFQFFCKYGLKITPRERVEINPLSKGNIIHFCLEKIISTIDKSGKRTYNSGFTDLSEEEILQLIDLNITEYLEKMLGGNFGKSSRFSFLIDKYKQLIFEVVKNIQIEFSQSKFRPADFEFNLIKNGGSILEITAKNGVKISISGLIDRIDICEENGKNFIRIVDYKSGQKDLDFEDIYSGINLQMILYLYAVTKGKSSYNGTSPAGLLYFPAQFLEAKINRGDIYDAEKLEVAISDSKLSTFKMSGLIVDETALSLMETEKSGKFIKNKRDKSNILQPNSFEKLSNFAIGKVEELTERIFGGEISSIPLKKGEKLTCDYCDYWAVCGSFGSENCNFISKDDGKKLLLEISEETEKSE